MVSHSEQLTIELKAQKIIDRRSKAIDRKIANLETEKSNLHSEAMISEQLDFASDILSEFSSNQHVMIQSIEWSKVRYRWPTERLEAWMELAGSSTHFVRIGLLTDGINPQVLIDLQNEIRDVLVKHDLKIDALAHDGGARFIFFSF